MGAGLHFAKQLNVKKYNNMIDNFRMKILTNVDVFTVVHKITIHTKNMARLNDHHSIKGNSKSGHHHLNPEECWI